MTERHRRRDTRLARENPLPVLRIQVTQVQQINLHALRFQRLLRRHSLLLIALHKGLRRRKVVLNRLRVRREGNSGELS